MTTEEERRHYDNQIGVLQATVGGLQAAFEDFRGEQRGHNEAVIDRLDRKINGKIDRSADIIGQHTVELTRLTSDIEHLKKIQIPVPAPGTKTTVEVVDSDYRPLTRRDLQVAVGVTLAMVAMMGLIFKYGPALLRALQEGAK